MRYSTVLLDLDHTLFDTNTSEAAAFSHTLNAAGISQPARYTLIYQRINNELWSAVERGEITPPQVRTARFDRLIAEAELDADPNVLADEFVKALGANGDLYIGAREVIEQLSERVTLAMVTNGFSEVQRTRIERLGIGHHFDAVIISAEVGASKPSVEFFDHAFEQLDCPPKETMLMVGDSLSADIRGGSDFGIATCWYNPDKKSAASTDSVTHEISRLEELLGIVA